MPRYIYGLDPASKQDYFGIVIHELPDDASPPKLKHIDAITHQSFDRMYDHLQGLFNKYEPFYICIDYSNERTLSDLIVRQRGDKVETIVFSTATKLMLKEDGLAIMKQGYKFPWFTKVTSPRASNLISQLINQLQSEQIIATRTGKTTFDHPSGQHNDLAIAWELSIHGCLRFKGRDLIGIGPHEIEELERPKSSIKIVDQDGNEIKRDEERTHTLYRGLY